MWHAAVRSARGTLLFRNGLEGYELWKRLTRGMRLRCAVLMPDHLHAGVPDAAAAGLAGVLRGYALWRNAARGESGPVFDHPPSITPVRGREHERRTTRYLYLNPPRAGLVDDPLAWPFSTHRDAVGLALPPVIRPAPDPAAFHRYVSADPSVALEGTALPIAPPHDAGHPLTPAELAAAVSALTRTPAPDLRRRGPARTLLVRACRTLGGLSSRETARALGLGHATAARASATLDRALRVVEQVARDPRFPLLHGGDLTLTPAWRRYRTLR
jgi:hypothetical protein